MQIVWLSIAGFGVFVVSKRNPPPDASEPTFAAWLPQGVEAVCQAIAEALPEQVSVAVSGIEVPARFSRVIVAGVAGAAEVSFLHPAATIVIGGQDVKGKFTSSLVSATSANCAQAVWVGEIDSDTN